MAADFLDTNVIIRYVTNDNPDQSARSLAFLQEVEAGRQTVTTCEGVLVEAVQVLESKRLYNFPRSDIQATLADLIAMRGLQLPHKPTYLRALELYASTNLDFVDALGVAHMERLALNTIVSFDRGFDRIQGIRRREP
jgi:predicted nucleic acid-binding protein